MAAKLQLVLCVAVVVLGTALAKWQPTSEDEKRAVLETKVAVLHEQLQVTCLTTWSLPLSAPILSAPILVRRLGLGICSSASLTHTHIHYHVYVLL